MSITSSVLTFEVGENLLALTMKENHDLTAFRMSITSSVLTFEEGDNLLALIMKENHDLTAFRMSITSSVITFEVGENLLALTMKENHDLTAFRMSITSSVLTFEEGDNLLALTMKENHDLQSNFGGSNSLVSNTRDRSNSFVGPGNFPIHVMLKYTPGSNSRTQSTVRRAIFQVKSYDGSNQIFIDMNQSHA